MSSLPKGLTARIRYDASLPLQWFQGLQGALGADHALARAREMEAEYNWLEAAESYTRIVDSASQPDPKISGEIHERMGYAYFRAAMQSDTREAFKERIDRSIASYQKAGDLYGKLTEPGRALRCDAMIAHLGFWLSPEASQKKRLLDEEWKLTKEALKAFREAGEGLEFGRTHNEHSAHAVLGVLLDWNLEARNETMRELAELGKEAIRLLSSEGDSLQLSTACVRVSRFEAALGDWTGLEEGETYRQEARGHWRKACELSEDMAIHQLYSVFLQLETDPTYPGVDKWINMCKTELEHRRKTRDKLTIGWMLEWLSFESGWKAHAAEDPDERMQLYDTFLQYAEEAERQYSPICFASPRFSVFSAGSGYTDNYWARSLWETNLEQRRDLLEKALKTAPDMLKKAENSGYPEVVSSAHHTFSRVLASLAKLEAAPAEKKKLLMKALEHRQEAIRVTDRIQPYYLWGVGLYQNYLGDIESQLGDLADDPEARKKLFEEAVQHKDTGLKLCIKYNQFLERTKPVPDNYAIIGRWQNEYGDLLNRLHHLTNSRENLRKAAEAFLKGAELFKKPNQTSRIAECYWNAARANDGLDEHLKAAELFRSASKTYGEAADKIPQLKEFYHDYTRYMEAWSDIESAKHHHARQEYDSAREFYEKTASLHKSTGSWAFLAGNYSALAKVEEGENLSRNEQSQEAIQAFRQAAELFSATKVALQTELGKAEDMDRKQMTTSLLEGTGSRLEYCSGRVSLEEAKLFYGKGDHYSSSKKYGNAAETFEKIADTLESEQDRREIKAIATLSRAWQKMSQAEEEESPQLYLEASELFQEAKELGPNEKTRSLALGHSRFCKALEAGTRFVDTRDIKLHSVAIQHLESAASYYLKAGMPNASEYAEAMELLLDAHLHMNEAKNERDHEKKAKLYSMTEKVLQASAESFLNANQPAQEARVLRLVEKVKRERELALSLTDIALGPTFLSTTSAFLAPMPRREDAVGLETFERAHIQARLITRQTNLKVGENLELEIELINAGKGPAQLVKLEDLIPDGFELTSQPESCRVEDHFLNMKGRRLDPLKTAEVKLALKPKVQGQFSLKPRILYLDESGKYRTHEPEPIQITVKELGISGWLKGG